MSAENLIDRYVRVIMRSAETSGWDVETVCQAAGFEVSAIHDDNHRFTPRQLAIVTREIRKYDDFMGQIPRDQGRSNFEFMCEIAMTKHNLRDALKLGFRYFDTAVSEFRFHLEETGDGKSEIRIAFNNPHVDPENIMKEWWLRSWHRLSGWLIGKNVPLLEVNFSHQPSVAPEEYDAVYGCECQFEQPHNSIVFGSRYLSDRIVRTKEHLEEYVNHPQIDLITFPHNRGSFKERVTRSLHDHFTKNRQFPTIDQIASECYVGSQTLRRRLREEDTSYSLIKEQIRRQVVEEYLTGSNLPLSEIGRLGGFAEPSGFARAVKSWSGLSPREFRKKHAEARQRAYSNY
ncbi:AraC family transcriptional regulator [Pseudomaricurvus alkylphenolicus]|uniref:AraC family transcriptional regulator n=1 Tax=Pseudomaricurvus alkylphenolicus TaxID=1306991 RepID=UPI00141EF6DA|nr:AraC family transcriptional regulator [Pseudomaricurvus alkylphenolicus]NIB37994.1 AraC family transcriptional regulator [Pseudomaricurvus alkylphenolicus]